MGGKKKYKKAVKSLDERILEHKEKHTTAKNPELFYYWEKEIRKLEGEKRKKQKRV